MAQQLRTCTVQDECTSLELTLETTQSKNQKYTSLEIRKCKRLKLI